MSTGLTRRDALGLAASAALAGAMPAVAGSLHRSPLDFGNRADLFLAYAKMRGSFTAEPVIWWYRGITYGVVDATVKRLFAVETAAFTRARVDGEQQMTLTTREIGYFISLDDGAVLESWRNPYTGKTVSPIHTKLGPSNLILTPGGVTLGAGAPPGTETSTELGPPTITADWLYLPEDFTGSLAGMNVRNDKGEMVAARFRASDLSTFCAPVREIQDAALATAPSARFIFQSVVTWSPWMGMGTAAGHTMGRGQGVKFASLADLPSSILKPLRERDPQFLKDPESWTRATNPVRQFEERKP